MTTERHNMTTKRQNYYKETQNDSHVGGFCWNPRGSFLQCINMFYSTLGNLERECIEEICDHEEAREVFEQTDKTVRLHFVLFYFTVSLCDHRKSYKSTEGSV